jgi:thioredoxin 1
MRPSGHPQGKIKEFLTNMDDKVRVLTAEGWDREVLQAEGPVLVDLWAEWCPPCRKMGPVVEELARLSNGQVTVGKLNVDQHPEVAERYDVRSIPTFLVFRGGAVVDRRVGAMPLEELQALLAAHKVEAVAR